MTEEKQTEKPSPVIPMQTSDLISVLALGGAVGLIIWLLGMVLNRFVFESYFCQGDITAQCTSAKNYAVAAASLVGGIGTLAGLIRLRVYRPLLVLLASLISTWGLVQLSWNFGTFTGILAVVLLFATAFGLFAWLARIRTFWMALAAIIIATVAVRLVLAL